MAQTIRVKEKSPRRAMREDPDTPMKGIPAMTNYTSTRRHLWTIRIAAVLHALLALIVLMALTRMDNTQVQAAAAYMWAFLALLLAVGTFTSDKEAK